MSRQTLLDGRLIGLEKESLRVESGGGISLTDHPHAFGSALTNPHITTDYSEALLEIVSPPVDSPEAALQFIEQAHRFIYPRLTGGETIWATSMPCVLNGDESIRVGEYGNSNAGRMKHAYRQGLGLRYGKSMQAIAGVHFNYSFPKTFWKSWAESAKFSGSLVEFTTDEYFHMTRNLLRVGWLVPYLFGASPAVCTSFLKDGEPLPGMKRFGKHTCYEPQGTSLRMGDIGYVYRKDSTVPVVRVDYNSLDGYLADLLDLIETPDERYEKLGLRGADGEFHQLSTNRLQIENEYYSSVRPKQIPDNGEMPLLAMARSGIRYLELRSVDVNVFEPVGVCLDQIRFLEVLMLQSLLSESPPMSTKDLDRVSANMSFVAHRGRDPELQLVDGSDRSLSVSDWGESLLEGMQPAAAFLDSATGGEHYATALAAQMAKMRDPELTPSARVLREMHEHHGSFFDFAMAWSQRHAEHLGSGQNDSDQLFTDAADRSLIKLAEIEAASEGSLESYLNQYFSQLGSEELSRLRRRSEKPATV